MPPVSEKQRAAMWAAAAGHSTSGIPESVGKEFANSDPGGELPAKAKDLAPEEFGLIKRALVAMGKFFSEEQQEEEHHGNDVDPPKGRAASVAFICPDGKTLFIKRADDENDPHSGKWCWPGGQCEDEEEFEAAARREALEEAGKDCSFDGIAELHKTRTERGWDHVTYTVPVKEPFEPTLSDECQDHTWAYPDEAPDPLHPGCRATLDEVLKPEDPTPAKPRIKPIVAVRDAADPTGKLSETTREEIGSETHRENMPESAFLIPAGRKYPVKEEEGGEWKYTRNLLLAATRRARMQGRNDLAKRADAIRAREFGTEDAETAHDPKNGQFTSGSHPPTHESLTSEGWRGKGLIGGHTEYSHPQKGSERVKLYPDKKGWLHTKGFQQNKKTLGRGTYEGTQDTKLEPAEGGWMRQVINAGSEMPAYMKSQHITPGQLERGKQWNTGANDAQLVDWSRFRPRSPQQRQRLAMDRALPDLKLARAEGYAFDRGTARDYDSDGRMHVKDSNLTKANICPYFGHEIPDYEKLGLDPEKKYMLLRHPDELEKAVKSANGLPLLDKHKPATAADHPKELTVGATGSNARWEAPYIKNDLSIWPEYASRAIEDGSQRELSAGYSYTPDMTPGTYQDAPYDGIMRDIKFNHVALVNEGRAGKDVAVADAMPSSFRKFARSC